MNDSSTATLQVDPRNPGQFFACCGIFEVAHRLSAAESSSNPAESWFDSDRFHVTCPRPAKGMLIDLIRRAAACLAVEVDWHDRKVAPLDVARPLGLRLDWWLGPRNASTRFKTWAANATSLQMYTKWSKPLSRLVEDAENDPSSILMQEVRLQGSYGFDSSVGWNALDVGFSLNEHDNLKLLPLRPAVELFGAIGLQRFRPRYNRDGDVVEYRTWSVPLNVVAAAPIVSGAVAYPFATAFRSAFVKRGSFKGLDYAIRIGEES